jgi:hypothetical protein
MADGEKVGAARREGECSARCEGTGGVPVVELSAPRVVCEGASCPLARAGLVTLLPSGSVVATDYATLVRFDTNGTTTTIARNGNGPGEIQGPFALGADSAGRVLLFDIRRMRQIRYVDGAPPEEVSTMPPMSMLGLQSRGGARSRARSARSCSRCGRSGRRQHMWRP